jgi:hypothetical protein
MKSPKSSLSPQHNDFHKMIGRQNILSHKHEIKRISSNCCIDITSEYIKFSNWNTLLIQNLI